MDPSALMCGGLLIGFIVCVIGSLVASATEQSKTSAIIIVLLGLSIMIGTIGYGIATVIVPALR